MPIEFEHAIEVPQAPETVFAVLDNVSATPQWLARCVSLEKLSPDQNAPGTKLRYSYSEGGRTGVMDGEITHRVPNEHLAFLYQDKMMHVTVEFRLSRTPAGTRLVHKIAIEPQTFLARLLSPLIRKQLPQQTITAMETLRKLLAQS